MLTLEAVATAPKTARTLEACQRTRIHWHRTAHPDLPFSANVDGSQWQLRLNDFPAEPLYTLLIDGQPIGDLDDLPPTWATQ